MKHWRLLLWVALWLLPTPMIPNVLPLYWLLLMVMVGWAFRVRVILEPKVRVTDEGLWAWLDG